MKRYIITSILLLFFIIIFYSCSKNNSNTNNGNSLVIYCPHPLEFINPLVEDFKAKNPEINAVGLTFEEGGANYVSAGSPVKLVYMKEGVIIKPDGIYIIKNAKNLENAKKFVDYATSYDAQKTINDKLNRRSVRSDLPPSAILQATETINVISDDEAVVDKNKQNWLNKFKDVFTSI